MSIWCMTTNLSHRLCQSKGSQRWTMVPDDGREIATRRLKVHETIAHVLHLMALPSCRGKTNPPCAASCIPKTRWATIPYAIYFAKDAVACDGQRQARCPSYLPPKRHSVQWHLRTKPDSATFSCSKEPRHSLWCKFIAVFRILRYCIRHKMGQNALQQVWLALSCHRRDHNTVL